MIVMAPHHDPLGKGRGGRATSTNPLRREKKEVSTNKERKQERDTHFGHSHPTFEGILIHTFFPVIGINYSHVVMLEVGREGLIPIQRLSPSEVHGDGGWGPLSGGITAGGRGRDERVEGGRRGHDDDGKSEMMGGRKGAKRPLLCPATTLNPKNRHQNSPYYPQPPASRFSHHQNSPYHPQPPASRFSHHQNNPYYPQLPASHFNHDSRHSYAHRKVLEGQLTDWKERGVTKQL